MANILKIKNEQGEWIDVPAIKGDAGPQGQAGPQGPKGDPGEVTTQQMTDYVSQELVSKQDKLDSYSDSASVADDKLTINYKVKQEDGTYSNVPVEFSGGSKYTFTNGLTENNGTVSWNLNNRINETQYSINIDCSSSDGKPVRSEGLKVKGNSGSMYISDSLVAPGGNNQAELGFSFRRWKTLYCDKLSDGTTTKTMTDVLANSVVKYRHMIKLSFKVGELGSDDVFGTVNLDWINSVSTPYTSLTDLLNEIKSKVAANKDINCSGIWPEIEMKNGKLSNIGFSNSISWYAEGGTDKLFASIKDNAHYDDHSFVSGDREITVLQSDNVVAL